MTPADRITDYVMEKSEGEAATRRAGLYRDLAALSVDDIRAASMLKIAAELESIERRCRQLRLDLDGNHGATG